MLASIFKDFIEGTISKLAKQITQKVNGKEGGLVYEFKKYLTPSYSPDMKYTSLSSDTSIVAADVVALDSELPLKQRGKYSTAQGEIPKIGMKKAMNETQLQALKNLKARGNREAEIVKLLFKDLIDSVKGVQERLDIMFLQALSTGVTLISGDTNTGTGVRITFNIPDGNQFGATSKDWNEEDSTPISDIENVVNKARGNGHKLNFMFIDKVTYNVFKNNKQVKESYAGYHKVDPNFVFRINKEDLQSFITEEYDLTIIVIDKVVSIEKGGTKTAYEPWERGNVTFTTTTNLGSLTYGELAEMDHPVDGVQYGVVDKYILTSMYRTNDPLKENTSVQALALPVLDNTDSIYILNTKEATASESTQTEDDANFDYNGSVYTKQSVVDGINAARAVDTQVAEAKITHKDSTLAKKIDSLSKEGVELFEAVLVSV